MKTKAFTLAETLITLGIIGIVAAIILPSVIHKRNNKEFEAKLKKAYSALQQAVQRANYEVTDLNALYKEDLVSSNVTASGGEQLCEILGRQFANAKIHLPGTYNMFGRIKTLRNDAEDGNPCAFDGGYIETQDQMEIYFETLCNIYITIDINGKKGPNRLGYDVFTFILGEKDKIIPNGSKESKKYRMCVAGAPSDMSNINETCSHTSTSAYNGFGCAYPALTDPDYFKNLP